MFAIPRGKSLWQAASDRGSIGVAAAAQIRAKSPGISMSETAAPAQREHRPGGRHHVGAGKALGRAGRHDGRRQVHHRPRGWRRGCGCRSSTPISRSRRRPAISIPDIFETPWRGAFPGWRGAGDRAAARRRVRPCSPPAAAPSCARRPATASATRRSRSGSRPTHDVIMRRVKRRADRPLLQTADPAANRDAPAHRARAGLRPRRPDDRLARRAARPASSRNASMRCARVSVPATSCPATSRRQRVPLR